MFDIFANAQAFPCQAKLFFDGFKWGDKTSWVVGPVKVPGIEAGEVLQCSQELIATDYMHDQHNGLSDWWGFGRGIVVPVVATKRR